MREELEARMSRVKGPSSPHDLFTLWFRRNEILIPELTIMNLNDLSLQQDLWIVAG